MIQNSEWYLDINIYIYDMLWNTDVEYLVDQTYDSMLQSIFHFTFISTKLSELGSSIPRQFCAVAQPNRAIFEPLTSVRDFLSRRWVFQGWCHQVSCATCERCCCLVPSFLIYITRFHLYLFRIRPFYHLSCFHWSFFFTYCLYSAFQQPELTGRALKGTGGAIAPCHHGELPMTSHDQWMPVMPSTVPSRGSSVVRA